MRPWRRPPHTPDRATRLVIVGDMHHSIGPDGSLHAIAPLAAQLDRWAKQFDEVVITGHDVGWPKPAGFGPYRADNITFVELPAGGGSGLLDKLHVLLLAFSWARTIHRLVAHADAVHIRCPCNVSLIALFATRRHGLHRYAMYAGTWGGYKGEPWSYRLQRLLLRSPLYDGVATVYTASTPGNSRIVPFFSPSFTAGQWSTEADGVSASLAALATTTAVGTGERPLRIATIGRLSENKNQRVILEAVSHLAAQGVDVRLSCVGEGIERSALEQLSRALDIDDRVVFTGALDFEDVLEVLRTADLNVLATKQEGYGKVLLEGMLVGAIPICADSPMGRLIAPPERGRTFAPDDPGSLARAISDIMDPPELMRLVEAGRAYAATHTLEAFDDVVSEIVDGWHLSAGDFDRTSRRSHRVGVAQVIDTLDAGGAERMAVDVANMLDGQRFRSSVVATRQGGPLQNDLRSDVALEVLGRSSRWDLTGFLRFRRFLRDQGIDVVHSHGRSTAQFVGLGRALHVFRVRHVVHDHLGSVTPPPPYPKGFRWAVRLGADRYIAVSTEQREQARRELPLDRSSIHLVRNGVSLAAFDVPSMDVREVFRIPHGRVVGVAVANVRPVKDHATLLHALARAQGADRVDLLVVGSLADTAQVNTVRRLADDLGIASRVHLVGPSAQIPALVKGCDLGLLSSAFESGPLAILEYMAAGIPFAATATGEVAKVVQGRGVGIFTTPGDADALAGAIDELLSRTAAERAAMGSRGREVARSEFDQRVTVQQVEDIYANLVSGAPL